MTSTSLLEKITAYATKAMTTKPTLLKIQKNDNDTVYTLGCLVPTVIFAFLVVLKTVNIITWGWWVVFSIFWLPVAAMVLYAVIGIIVIIIVNIISD